MDDNAKSAEWWDAYFAPGGGWEQNNGRQQTRAFAEAFCRHVRLQPHRAFRLLDFGCALGEAIRVFHRLYPGAFLTGMDVSEVAIRRCKADLGTIATFVAGGLDAVQGRYDVIYTSNVLEHFTDYRATARRLLEHCDRLCVMVPFEQLDEFGSPLVPRPLSEPGGGPHHHTFLRDSFDFMIHEGRAAAVELHLADCPGAWGWGAATRMRHLYKNLFRRLKGKPPRRGPQQAIYDIIPARAGG